MIDDVFAFTARAFGIPPALMSGDVQGVNDALDQFLTLNLSKVNHFKELVQSLIWGEDTIE